MKKNLEKKNFIWNFLGLTINSFNSLFLLIIVNRVNGERFGGIFTYAYSLICMIYFVGAFYNRTFQINEMNINNSKDFVLNRFISAFMMFFITSIFLAFASYPLDKNIIILLICLFRMIESIADVFYGIAQANGNLYKAGKSMFVKGIIGIVLFGLIDIFTKNLYLSILTLSIVNLIILLLYDIRNTYTFIKESKMDSKNVLLIFKKSIPIFVFQTLNIYLVNSSKYTLDFLESANIVNIFGIIMMPGTIISLIGQYILNPYIVKLSKLFKNKEYKKFNKLIERIIVVLFVIGIVCTIGIYLLGIPILNFIYGLNLSDYKIQLCIIVFFSIFIAIVAVLTCGLTIFKRNNAQMYIYIGMSLFSLIISIIMIRKYGIYGATLTYSITMFLLSIIYYVYYKLQLKRLYEE